MPDRTVRVFEPMRDHVLRELEVYEDICAADFRFINASPCDIQPVLDEMEAEGVLRKNGFSRKRHPVFVLKA